MEKENEELLKSVLTESKGKGISIPVSESEPQNKMTTTIEIGTQVERIASDYTNGRKGEVIEINEGRARVRWSDSPRTWVKFSALKVIDQKVIAGPWSETPNMKSHKAARTVTLPDGTTYREYRK